jgi:hypothetical protein
MNIDSNIVIPILESETKNTNNNNNNSKLNKVTKTGIPDSGSYSLNNILKLVENNDRNNNSKLNKVTKTGNPALNFKLLVDIKVGGDHSGTWIHPDLAIQLAQWISPIFALQVSKWIRTLLTDGKVELLQNKDNEIKMKDNEIKMREHENKLLKDMYLKKQTRIKYPQNNVIYMLTTEDHKKNRIYIIGKANKLHNRLSGYNKTAEHEVIYYKQCNNEDHMSTIENMILTKLNNYKEKANRDRFILPLEKNINYFIDIINNCINFFN